MTLLCFLNTQKESSQLFDFSEITVERAKSDGDDGLITLDLRIKACKLTLDWRLG